MSFFPTDTFRFPAENFRRPAALARFILPMVLGLALDLWVKNVAFNILAVEPPRQVTREDAHGNVRHAWAVNLRDQYTYPHNLTPPTIESLGLADPNRHDDGRNDIPLAMGGYALLPGWVHFTVAVNEGAALGIGQGWRALFILISIAAIVFLAYLFAHSARHRLYQVVLGLLLAGVLGNMYDRIVYHYVRDMIRVFPRWPGLFPWVFNVADMLLCCGVGYMMLSFLFMPHRIAAPAAPPEEEDAEQKQLKVWT